MDNMQQSTPTQPPQKEDKLSVILIILSFCIPLAGVIIWAVKKSNEPQSAKTACYAAIAGFGLGVLINIIFAIAGIGLGN